MIYLLIHVK